jgi:hypothetical protein
MTAPCRHKDKCPLPSGEALQALPRMSRWVVQSSAASLEPYHPSHVKACINNDLDSPAWFLNIWRRELPDSQMRMGYTCGSYRCPSAACQAKAAHTDFARIKSGLDCVGDARGWVFFVLTLDQHNTFKTLKKPYKNEQEAFKRLQNNTRFFLRRLRRRQKELNQRVLGNEWCATVEVQRNGWPHLNLIVYAPELADELRLQETSGPHDGRRRRHRAQIVLPWLLEAITETNWGTISTAEGVKNEEAMAGYIVKIGGNFGRTSGEVAKITQAPVNARMKLRRIRAGRGFLPSQRRKTDYTGIMMRRKRVLGRMTVSPMLKPEQVKPVGQTVEEQEQNYALYARGVRIAQAREDVELQQYEILKELARAGPVGGHLSRLAKCRKNSEIRLVS